MLQMVSRTWKPAGVYFRVPLNAPSGDNALTGDELRRRIDLLITFHLKYSSIARTEPVSLLIVYTLTAEARLVPPYTESGHSHIQARQ